MQDWYQMPALILTAMLLPAFGYLYARTRDIRNLLWFLAFLCTVLRMALLYPTTAVTMPDTHAPWAAALAESLAMLAAGLFLGSLSPLFFMVGKRRVLYAIPYTVAADHLRGAQPFAVSAGHAHRDHVLGISGAGTSLAGSGGAVGPTPKARYQPGWGTVV